MDRFDLDDLIRRAKERLAEKGLEINALNVYRTVPIVRRELIHEQRKQREQERQQLVKPSEL